MIKKSIILSAALATVLSASGIKLDDVVVTAKTRQEVANTPASYTIITAKDIAKMSQNSIAEILQTSVGVMPTVNDSSIFGRGAFSIRGMSSNHTLILLNGHRISGTDAQIGHSNFQYNWVPIESIEKIEIIRGPMSSIYGSKGLAGVVNIITKPAGDKFYGNLSLEGGKVQGSNGGDEYALLADVSGKVFDKLGIKVSLEKRNIDTTSDENNSSITKREGKDIVNALIDLNYYIDDTQTINASMLFGNEDRQTLRSDKYYEIEKRHYSLGYSKKFEKFGIDLNAYRTKSDSHSETFKYTHRLKDDVFNAEANTDIFENHYIIVGGEYRQESYHKDYDAAKDKRKDFQNEISYKAGYIQDEISLTDGLFLTLGLRYDKHEKFGGHISPKAYVVYEASDALRIKGGYGGGFNAPTVTQSSGTYKFLNPFAGYGFYGNDDLKPETSDNYEFGFDYATKNTSLEVMGFYNEIQDLIGSKFLKNIPNFIPKRGDIRVLKYSNVNEVKTWGAEVSWSHKNVIDKLDYSLGYTFLRTKNENTGQEITLRPRHKLDAKLAYEFPYQVNTSLIYQFIGEQKEDMLDRATRKVKRITLPSYQLVGLQASKVFFNDLKFSLGVENLFDEELDERYGYDIRGRYFYARLNYTF